MARGKKAWRQGRGLTWQDKAPGRPAGGEHAAEGSSSLWPKGETLCPQGGAPGRQVGPHGGGGTVSGGRREPEGNL